MKHRDIRIGVGLGELLFGLHRDQVRDLIGEPERVDEDCDLNDDVVDQIWRQYETADLQLGFNVENDFRLSMLEIRSPEYTFDGHHIVGMKREAVLDLVTNAGMEIATINEPSDNEAPSLVGVAMINLENPGLTLWFKDDVLKIVQWFVRYDDSDEVVWPEQEESVK